MKYIIIGLGNYGRVLAEELSALGHEIIGADISESRVAEPTMKPFRKEKSEPRGNDNCR